MEFLRITAVNGTHTYIPDNYVANITVSADTQDAGSDYRAPNVIRGKITGVKYYDGANGTAGALVVVTSIAAFNGTNTRYAYGCFTVDGAFVSALVN
jgi:hypothetical protein